MTMMRSRRYSLPVIFGYVAMGGQYREIQGPMYQNDPVQASNFALQ